MNRRCRCSARATASNAPGTRRRISGKASVASAARSLAGKASRSRAIATRTMQNHLRRLPAAALALLFSVHRRELAAQHFARRELGSELARRRAFAPRADQAHMPRQELE